MLTRLQGPESKQVALAKNNLGTVLREENKLAEAEDVHRQALEIQQKLSAEGDMAGSLNNLGFLLLLQHRLDQAEPMMRDSIKILKKLQGDQSPILFMPLGNLVQLLRERGDLAQAEQFARELMIIYEKLPNDWRFYDTQSVLGGLLTAGRKLEAAEPLLVSGQQGLQQRAKNIPPRFKGRLKRAGERLVEFYEAVGATNKVVEWRNKVTAL
jgi:tetratricopeptide (TPR) repeat protein